MSAQTPTNYDRKSNYTSPIGLLKNYNTMNAQNGNSSYEEQFFKIKALRLESEIEELKQENSILKSKLAESSTTNQILKQKVIALENALDRPGDRYFTHRTVPSFITDSGYPSANNSGRGSPDSKYSGSATNDKSQRFAHNNEIERLLKENRVLKNDHELQKNKLKDDNKKLTRRLIQVEANLQKITNNSEADIEDKAYRQKQEQRYLKMEKANNDLRKENEQFQKQKKKLQDKFKNLQQSNKTLKRENDELKVISSTKQRYETALQDYQAEVDRQKKEIKKLQNQIDEINVRHRSELSAAYSSSKQPSRPLQASNRIPVVSDGSKLEKEVELLKRKIAMHQQSLVEKDDQIKSILIKLKPLMEKQRGSKNQRDELTVDPKRASLSLLQVFLKKYKINSF